MTINSLIKIIEMNIEEIKIKLMEIEDQTETMYYVGCLYTLENTLNFIKKHFKEKENERKEINLYR